MVPSHWWGRRFRLPKPGGRKILAHGVSRGECGGHVTQPRNGAQDLCAVRASLGWTRRSLIPLVCWLAAGLAFAQTPPSASVEGVVTDALTGLPVADTSVSVNGPGNIAPVKTDDKGHFVIRGLAAAQYQIVVLKADGYTTKSTRVRLVTGQELKGVDLKLDKEAVLAGRILDKEKNPVIGSLVSVRGKGFRNGRPTLTSFHSTVTNDLGEYRFSGLNPGQYYLEAEPKPLAVKKRAAAEGAEEKPPVIANVRTYYGSTSSFDSAAPFDLASGQRMEGFDMTLLRERTVCIASTIEDTASQGGRILVTVSELMPMSQSRVAAGSTASGEEFEICGLAPGGYRLWSFTTAGGTRYGSQTFQLAGRAMALPRIAVQGTVSVRGKITVADAKPEDPLPVVRLRLENKDRIAISGEDTTARIEPNGDFTIPSAVYDDYWLDIFSLPVGYYIKDATQAGREARRDPVRAGAGELNIVLGADGPSLSGQVMDKENKPVPNAAVILSVASLPQAVSPGQILSTITDQNGQYTLNNMAPGEYRLIAFADARDYEVADPQFLRGNLGKATDVRLSARERKSQNLTAVGK